jgi:hypothetical protein
MLCLTESWLNSSHSEIEIKISGYKHYRCDRNNGQSGGGVIVYVIDKPDLTVEKFEVKTDIEYICLKMRHINA